MKKSLILAIFLGALSYNEVQAVFADPTADVPAVAPPAKPTPKEEAQITAKKAGVAGVAEEIDMDKVNKGDRKKAMTESSAAEAQAKALQQMIEARIKAAQSESAQKKEAKVEKTAEEKKEAVEKAITEKVKVAKAESDEAKEEDHKKTETEKEAAVKRGHDIIEKNKKLVKDVEAETAKQNAADKEVGKAAAEKTRGLTDEEWTANMPNHHLKGYLGTEADVNNEEQNEEVDDVEEESDDEQQQTDSDDESDEDDGEGDAEGSDDEKPKDQSDLMVGDEIEYEDDDHEDDQEESDDEEQEESEDDEQEESDDEDHEEN